MERPPPASWLRVVMEEALQQQIEQLNSWPSLFQVRLEVKQQASQQPPGSAVQLEWQRQSLSSPWRLKVHVLWVENEPRADATGWTKVLASAVAVKEQHKQSCNIGIYIFLRYSPPI